MRILIRLLLFVIVAVAVLFGIQQYAAESGEVVVLTTQDDQGATVQTRLWVVDHDGVQWLRAGMTEAGWYARLSKAETIRMERAGITTTYRAEADPDAAQAIHAAMLEKYGWADRFIGALFGGRDGSIAIRLIPVS